MSESIEDLPENFREARAKDEGFWKQQEKRIQGALGQPCCTLSGISTGLIKMPGDFAVIVHGEDECAACFRHIGPGAANFFATGLTEKEFVTGETREPLERCLRVVAAEVQPQAIFVLGACPVEVIGDRFERVVEDVQKDYPDIPMLALHTSGLKVGSQAAMLDWMFSTLASLPAVEPVDETWRRKLTTLGVDLVSVARTPDGAMLDWAQEQAKAFPERQRLVPERCLNFIGTPVAQQRGMREPEYTTILRDAGLHVVGNYPEGATFRQWRAVTFAKASFVADRSLYPKLVGVLEDRGQTVREVPLPTGVTQTRDFYRLIGEVYGVEEAIEAAMAEPAEKAEIAVAAFKEKYGGLRVAMGLRMLNNYQADQLAYQGLGDFRAMAELGFDLTVMVQGPPDKRAKFEKLFANRGIDIPFEMFPEPWTLSEYIGDDRFDVAYMADHCRGECRKAGVPMIVSREFDPYFSGVLSNLGHLDRMLRQSLRR